MTLNPDTLVDEGGAKTSLILVVDDVPENRSALCRRLERMGYRFCAADGGQAALALIEAEQPDVVLLDYMMPDMSGLDVVKELRRSGNYSDLPVIMVTARTDPESVVDSLAAGANDYVTKPIDFKSLGARIAAQLKRTKQSRALKDANSDLDWKATSRALELDDLQEQLTMAQQQNAVLEEKVQALKSDSGALSVEPTVAEQSAGTAPETSIDPQILLPRLRRIEMLATRLAAMPSGAAANPAILAEIASLARSTLGDFDND